MNEDQLQTPKHLLDGDDLPLADDSATGNAKHLAMTAGQVAASAVLATSLAAVLSEPPRPELITLPEPTPIVQTYSPYMDEVEPAESEDDDTESNRWRRLLKLLKYLAVALLFAATVAFGLLKGCVGCTAGLLLPPDEPPKEEQSEQEEEAPAAAEDAESAEDAAA